MLGSAHRNHLLTVGFLAGLLAAAAPAMAFTSFVVDFDSTLTGTSTGETGVTGKMTFNFTKNSGNQYTLDLDIANSTKVSGNPSGTLVGFAFNVPGAAKVPPDIKLLTYSPLTSGFGDVYGATVTGARTMVSDGGTLAIGSNAGPANFDNQTHTFCARDTGNPNNCLGGHPNGLKDGQPPTKVRFTLASNVASIDSAEEVALSFFTLFNSWNPVTDPNASPVALRFQDVTTTTGQTGKSDKVGGIPRRPPNAPGDAVPGPVPVLGAATAFAFSRKLRRRIAAADLQTNASA